MSDQPISSSSVPPVHLDVQQMQQIQAQKAMAKYAIAQESSQEEFSEWTERVSFNPMQRRAETLETKTRKTEKQEETQKTGQGSRVAKAEEVAEQYQKKNRELHVRTLLDLRNSISEEDTPDQILQKVLKEVKDFSLADEVLDYLLETTEDKLSDKVRQAKEDFNAAYGREIRAGRNIGTEAQRFSALGFDTPTGLRDLYRDITGNPRDASTLFDELSKKYDFGKMKPVISFLLHSLGSDLKAKGPSISRAELHRLMTDIRALQAILGVYLFFRFRMRSIKGAFKRGKKVLPGKVNFEALARLFMKYLQDRYPSADKVLQFAALLDLMDEFEGQVIVYTNMRDAMRHVAPRLFKSEQHRHDVLLSFMEAIEELDEKLEEEEEEEEDEQEETDG